MKEKIKVVIPAAGFGTRLGEEGERKPKGLIGHKKETILGIMLDNLGVQLSGDNEILAEIVVVTNNKFYKQYTDWFEENYPKLSVEIINNGIDNPEERNGAVVDLMLGIESLGSIDNVLVLPSDTDFSDLNIAEVINLARMKNASVTVGRKADKEIIAGRFGCLLLDGNKIVGFEEKPENPKSDVLAIPVYLFNKDAIETIREQIENARDKGDKNLIDAPGKIIEQLIDHKKPVYIVLMESETIDVGTPEDRQKFLERRKIIK